MINKQELEARNVWWTTDDFQVPELAWPKRDLYKLLLDNMDHALMLNVVGLRRVGKSTLLKQVIGELLNQKVKPKNIFYYLFDYTTQQQSSEFLDEVLAVYFEEILKQPKHSQSERVYILLDEIQYIENWQAVLKKYYDLSNKKIKFIITGSQSVLLKNKNRESLAGRVFDFYLQPMSFREFININREDVKLLPTFDLFNLDKIYSDLATYDSFYSQKIIDLAKEYITLGQFPEMRNIKQTAFKHDYIIESVVGKTLEDCVRIFNIDKRDEFKLFFGQLLNNVGSIFELNNISREAGISLPTANNYLEYLQDAYVFELLFKHYKSLIKKGRLQKKVYTPCPNFVCAFNRFLPEHVDQSPEIFGKIVENVVYNILFNKYKLSQPIDAISFWRDGDEEIDFLLNIGKAQLPIEVKFSNNINVKDLKPTINFVKNKKLKYGLVVTKNELCKKVIDGQTLYYIPYYLILMMI